MFPVDFFTKSKVDLPLKFFKRIGVGTAGETGICDVGVLYVH